MRDSSSASWTDHQVRHLTLNAQRSLLALCNGYGSRRGSIVVDLSRSVCNTMDMQVRILPGEGSNYRVQSGEVHALVSSALCQGRRLHILPL